MVNCEWFAFCVYNSFTICDFGVGSPQRLIYQGFAGFLPCVSRFQMKIKWFSYERSFICKILLTYSALFGSIQIIPNWQIRKGASNALFSRVSGFARMDHKHLFIIRLFVHGWRTTSRTPPGVCYEFVRGGGGCVITQTP